VQHFKKYHYKKEECLRLRFDTIMIYFHINKCLKIYKHTEAKIRRKLSEDMIQ